MDPQNLNRYSYVLNSPQNYTDPSGYFHQIKKKKMSFWTSGFGIFFRFIVNTLLAAFNVPLGAGEGTSGLGGPWSQLVMTIRDATDDELTARRNGGDTLVAADGSSGALIPGLSNAGGGGFFSPALQLGMEAGSDIRLDLLRLLIGFLQANEAHAGDNDTGSKGARPGGRLYGKNIPEAKPQVQRPFEIHPRVEGQLKDPSHMGSLAGKLTPKDIQNLSVNPAADRYFDVRTGNINVINNVDGATLRITVPRDTMRIISVGRAQPNNIQNLIQRGDWVPLP